MSENYQINEPILVIERKNSFKIKLYYIFFTLWILATMLVAIVFINIDNIIPNILGYIALIFIPYWLCLILEALSAMMTIL